MHTATLTATDEFGNEDLVVRWRNYNDEAEVDTKAQAVHICESLCKMFEGFQFVLDLPGRTHLEVWEGGDEWSSATRTPSEQEQVEVQPSDLGTRSHMIR